MNALRNTIIAVSCTLILGSGCSSGKATTKMKSTVVTLQAANKESKSWPASQTERAKLMQQAAVVVEKRLSQFTGLDGADVNVKDDDKLVVVLNGMTGPQEVASAVAQISSQATLEFYYIKDIRSRYNPTGAWKMREATAGYDFTNTKGKMINSIKQPAEVMSKVVKSSSNPPILTGKDILQNAKSAINRAQQPVIEIEFNASGTEIFRKFTRQHVNEYLAIFYGGKLLTAPSISEPIPNGMAEITGFETLAEARNVANLLNSGAQVVPLKVIKQEVVEEP